MTPEPTLREIGRSLTAEVRALSARIGDLDDALRRGRHIIAIIAVSLVFDLLFSVGLYELAHRNTETIRKQCVTANEVRAQNLTMWEGLFSLFPPPATADEQTREDAIIGLARQTFIPRKC